MGLGVVAGGRAVAQSIKGQVFIDGVSVAGRQEIGRKLEYVVVGLGAAVGAGLVERWLRRCGLSQTRGLLEIPKSRFWRRRAVLGKLGGLRKKPENQFG